MNNKVKPIAILIVLAVVGFGIWYALKPAKDSCEYTETLETGDRDFQPMLNGESKIKVETNYYKCNKPQKGEVVRYQLGQYPEFYYRIIVATEGDVISILKDKANRGWNLIVNDRLVQVGNSPYFFGVPDHRPTLALYMQENGTRTLNENELILFSSGPPGFNDSGIFGIFSAKDVKGRVQLSSDRKDQLDEFFANLYASEEMTTEYRGSLPKNEATKKPPVGRNKPVAPTTTKPNQGKPQKRR